MTQSPFGVAWNQYHALYSKGKESERGNWSQRQRRAIGINQHKQGVLECGMIKEYDEDAIAKVLPLSSINSARRVVARKPLLELDREFFLLSSSASDSSDALGLAALQSEKGATFGRSIMLKKIGGYAEMSAPATLCALYREVPSTQSFWYREGYFQQIYDDIGDFAFVLI